MKLNFTKKLIVSMVVLLVLVSCYLPDGSGIFFGMGWAGEYSVDAYAGNDYIEINADSALGEPIVAVRTIETTLKPSDYQWSLAPNRLTQKYPSDAQINPGSLKQFEFDADLSIDAFDDVWFKIENGTGDKYLIYKVLYDTAQDWIVTVYKD